MERIFKNLPRKKADLILLILASQDIPARADQHLLPHRSGQAEKFDILVPGEHRDAAAKNIDHYFRENKLPRLSKRRQEIEISSFNTPAAYAIMAMLLAVHLACQEGFNIHEEMVLRFGASSLYIRQGETFRAVTALFLHSNGQHLLGNLAGILIFAAPLISLLGYGTGPFFLLCAGTCGNLINAGFHQTGLLSIGASTAIMGAAGGLAAYQMTRKGPPFQWNRLMPLFAGATLVAMFSHGENTDISAHVFGFVSGLLEGILFFPFYRVVSRQFSLKFLEPAALVLSVLILGSAILTGV